MLLSRTDEVRSIGYDLGISMVGAIEVTDRHEAQENG